MKNKFDEVAIQCGSDKSTKKHGYTKFYEEKLSYLCDENISLGEIGLQITDGNYKNRIPTDFPSVKMWKTLFPKAKVFGFDISDFSRIAKGFNFTRGDSGNLADLDNFGKTIGSADVIIEDGSHATSHQRNALVALTPYVKSGGWFIIEDLHWQPWKEELEVFGKTVERYINGEPTDLDDSLSKYKNIDLKIYDHPITGQDTYRIVFLQKK